MNAAKTPTRRGFLKTAGLAGAGIAVSFSTGCSLIPPIPKNPVPEARDAVGWIRLTSEGRWQLYSPRMEMGQNILGSLQQIAAIELDVPASLIEVKLPSTQQIGRVKITAGSDSIREVSVPLAQACYALREAVLARAAQRLRVATSGLRFDGADVATASGARVSLRELAVESLELKAGDGPPERLRFMQAQASPTMFSHLDDILRGKALYAGAVRLVGMLYCVVLRPQWADQALVATALGSERAGARAVCSAS